MRRSTRIKQRKIRDTSISPPNTEVIEVEETNIQITRTDNSETSIVVTDPDTRIDTTSETETETENMADANGQDNNDGQMPQPNPIINQQPANNDITFDAATLAVLSNVAQELTYKGFNSPTMRVELISIYKREKNIANNQLTAAERTDIAKQIALCIIAYVKSGNSCTKAQRGISDNILSAALSNALRSLDVRDNARNGEGVTLSRIALSFIPVVYLCGIMVGISKRFNIDCPPHLQDPCFRGVPQIKDTPGYIAFIKQWNDAMSRTDGAKVKDKKVVNWDDVAILGFDSDGAQKDEMTRVIALGNLTQQGAQAAIARSIQNLLF